MMLIFCIIDMRLYLCIVCSYSKEHLLMVAFKYSVLDIESNA